MNKRELIRTAAKKAELSQEVMLKALTALTSTIIANLQKGEGIQLFGFGSFAVKARAARVGFNPATRKRIKIKAKKVVKFNPSNAIVLK